MFAQIYDIHPSPWIITENKRRRKVCERWGEQQEKYEAEGRWRATQLMRRVRRLGDTPGAAVSSAAGAKSTPPGAALHRENAGAEKARQTDVSAAGVHEHLNFLKAVRRLWGVWGGGRKGIRRGEREDKWRWAACVSPFIKISGEWNFTLAACVVIGF